MTATGDAAPRSSTRDEAGTSTDRDTWPGSREVLRSTAAREDPHDTALGDLAVAYYAGVPAEELAGDPVDALAAVRAHRSLARLRVPGRPVTAVLDTPGATGGGVGAGEPAERISVLVVTDDMPYLIDSVLAELDRTGATVHAVVHPVLVVRRDVRGELFDLLPRADPADPPPAPWRSRG